MNPNAWVGGYFSLPVDITPVLRDLSNASELKVFLYLHAMYWRAYCFEQSQWKDSHAEIAQGTGVCVSSVKTAIATLEEKGYLFLVRSPGLLSEYETALPTVKLKLTPRQRAGSQPADHPEPKPSQPADHPDSSLLLDKPSIDKSSPQSPKKAPSSNAARADDPEPDIIQARPIYEPNILKGVQRFAEESSGGGPGIRLSSFEQKHLKTQEAIARRLEGDEHTDWRNRLSEAIGGYMADPGINDIGRVIRGVWATQKRTYGPRPALSAEKPRSQFEQALRDMATHEGLTPSDARIPAWKLAILEAWKVTDEDGFTDRFTELCADGVEEKYSFDAVMELLSDEARDPLKKRKRSQDTGGYHYVAPEVEPET